MSDIVLRADSITRSFGERRVLHAATVCARAGTITVLFGRNGSGKSTLFRIVTGFERADQGVVFYDGTPRLRPRLHRLAREGLFFMPERGLLPRSGTLRDHLRIAAEFGGTALEPLCERLHLMPFLDVRSDTLSGGERRRAEVAVAYLRRPRCLLADEPFMGIAPADVDLISGVLRDMANGGCAVLASGHEVPQLLALADDVVWLTSGTTHALGTPVAARAHWQFQREYLFDGAARSSRPPAARTD